MDDNKNLNQPNTATPNNDDYQKILDEYAASVKPEDTKPEPRKPEIDLNITTSLKEAPVQTEENKIPEIKPDITETISDKPVENSSPDPTYLKGINSPQLESPIHPSLAANLEAEDDPENSPAIVPTVENTLTPPVTEINEITKPVDNNSQSTKDIFNKPVQSEPENSPTQKTPEEIKAEINKILADDSNNSLPGQKTSAHPFKGLFFVSLFFFFLIIAAWIYFLFFYQTNNISKPTNQNNISPTPTEVISEENCELNGFIYKVGESFNSADGCNTCSCQTGNNIACTEMACNISPTVIPATKSASAKTVTITPTKTATSSTQKTTPTIIPTLSSSEE